MCVSVRITSETFSKQCPHHKIFFCLLLCHRKLKISWLWELLACKIIILFKNVWTDFVWGKEISWRQFQYVYLQYLLVRRIELHFPFKKSLLLSGKTLALFIFCSSFSCSLCVLYKIFIILNAYLSPKKWILDFSLIFGGGYHDGVHHIACCWGNDYQLYTK